jgi:hypothetical protein
MEKWVRQASLIELVSVILTRAMVGADHPESSFAPCRVTGMVRFKQGECGPERK